MVYSMDIFSFFYSINTYILLSGTSPKKRLLSVDPFFPALNARTSGNQLRIRYKPFIVETGFLFTFKQKRKYCAFCIGFCIYLYDLFRLLTSSYDGLPLKQIYIKKKFQDAVTLNFFYIS